MEVKALLPIFIGKTKSFWFAAVPALLTLIDIMVNYANGDSTNAPLAAAIAWLLGTVFPVTPEQVFAFLTKIAPIYAFIGLYLRRGITQPYAATPSGEIAKPAAVLVKNVAGSKVQTMTEIVAKKIKFGL